MRKKLLSLTTLFVLLVATTGCAEKKLVEAVKAANAQCPVSFDAAGRLSQVFYDGESVGFAFEVNEDFFNIDVLQRKPESGKYDVKTMLSAPTQAQEEVLEYAADAGVPIKFIYVGLVTRKKAEVALTIDEVKECLAASRLSPLQKLMSIISRTNEQMPMEAGTDVTIERVEVVGQNLVYVYRIDNEFADIDQFADHVAEAKESVRQQVHSMGEADPAFKIMMTILLEAKMGLGYRYTKTDTDKFVDILLSTQELAALMHMDEDHEHGHNHEGLRSED